MRLSLPLLVPALACLAQADSGKLYIYDSQLQTASHESTTISPDAARLIIASRLGLDQYHDLGRADEETIQAINDLSASQQLFASSSSHETPVAFILAQTANEKDVGSNARSHSLHTVQISNMPSVASTEKLVLDLAAQSGMSDAGSKASRLSQLRNELYASPAGPLFRIAKDEEDFNLVLETLLRQDYTVLALAIPNDTTSKHTYGHYAHAALHKRQFKEAPLITESSPTTEPKLTATLSPAAKKNSTHNNGPLRGILPQCFSDLSTCQALTRNCTGHGACKLKWTDRDARPEAPCYFCSCAPEVRTNKDGSKKTTNWGGPACQKKDVVMPFWLLAGFSVFMVSLVSWAIGTLLTMGNEELPSVIGAGVSGVPRSK